MTHARQEPNLVRFAPCDFNVDLWSCSAPPPQGLPHHHLAHTTTRRTTQRIASEPAICTPQRLVPFRALADLLTSEEFDKLTVLFDWLRDNLEQDRATSRQHRS